uniref:TPX2_importin domain-containing protein n=1 Tax=Syphacia muris TaxID=451379 RepID=A0A0N5AC94_9BILA
MEGEKVEYEDESYEEIAEDPEGMVQVIDDARKIIVGLKLDIKKIERKVNCSNRKKASEANVAMVRLKVEFKLPARNGLAKFLPKARSKSRKDKTTASVKSTITANKEEFNFRNEIRRKPPPGQQLQIDKALKSRSELQFFHSVINSPYKRQETSDLDSSNKQIEVEHTVVKGVWDVPQWKAEGKAQEPNPL